MTQPGLQPDSGQPIHQTCPKCGKAKIQPETCPFCGIVFSRFHKVTSRPVTERKPAPSRSVKPLGIFQMGHYARFFRQLGDMLGAGCSLTESLEAQKEGFPKQRAQIEKMITAIDKGYLFVDSFAVAGKAFPSFVWGHLEAGERSGRLEELLKQLASELEARRKWILKQIFNFRTLWLMAIFLFAAISLGTTESVRQLTPEVVDEGQAAILGALAKGALSRFTFYGFFIGAAILAFAWFQIIGKHKLTQAFPAFENLRLRLPFFSHITRLEAWRRYLLLLGKMLSSGLTLPRSLKLAQQDIEFPSWQNQFDVIQTVLDRGGSLTEGFKQLPLVPGKLVVDMNIAEKTGTLSETLERQALAMATEIKNLQNVLQIVFLVGTFILGIFLALFVLIRGLGAWVPIYEKVLIG